MSEKTPSVNVKPPPGRVCHVFKIPASFVEEAEVLSNPLDQRSALQKVVQVKTSMGFVNCRADCALFDKATGNCLDVESKKALVTISAQIEKIDGLMRLQGGGS